ncbi:hypothetical protein ACOJUR_10205 [Alicyclobacillus tolerans]|uniref:Uncharacterized protein n=1 Tax=Alicyclobacillus tolerans TaxID=90970 RepID=A0ABT9LX28_9BACL|nr:MULTISPECIES: hypothetical protein [Alicyclobacillus]MDP9728721.1 hypothetical protein [Alicyclobacillus tengchongensis]QRF23263.1 hypothetical protein FY534_05940 [Alicyclobacillus sp. TC]
MVTRAHVTPYVGQRVVVRTHNGAIHHGILHSVTNDGIYLRPLRGQWQPANCQEQAQYEVLTRKNGSQEDVEEAWWPFFFLPWLAIAAFWPWAWWW